MLCAHRTSFIVSTLLLAAWLAPAGTASAAPIVWSGLTTSFTKPAGADHTLPANQDALTPNVVLTRDGTAGLFNIAQESAYDKLNKTSPLDTEWATSLNNPAQTIDATNWPALGFTSWASAYGGPTNLATNITTLDAVVHLITDDIYLDLRFTNWGVGFTSGGGFSYQRAEAATVTTGDYNGNGSVDAADYTVWRDTLGQSVTTPGDGADGNQSGDVDDGDYTFWKQHFGATVPGAAAGATVAAVPEPAAAVLALVGVMFAAGFRRWRLGA